MNLYGMLFIIPSHPSRYMCFIHICILHVSAPSFCRNITQREDPLTWFPHAKIEKILRLYPPNLQDFKYHKEHRKLHQKWFFRPYFRHSVISNRSESGHNQFFVLKTIDNDIKHGFFGEISHLRPPRQPLNSLLNLRYAQNFENGCHFRTC